MSTTLAVTLRPFVPADASLGHRLTTAFGWAHNAADWDLMARLGTGLVAEKDGVPVGTGLFWPFGADHATLGMISVDPAHQGHGTGRAIMEALLAAAGGRTIVLHATDAGLPLYEKLGFAADRTPAGTVRQFQGIVTPIPAAPAPVPRPAAASDAAAIRELDRAATGMDRAALLDGLLAGSECVLLGDDAFAVLRPFGLGEVVGPVVAPDRLAAETLVRHLLARREGRFVRMDVPEDSGLIPLLEAHGLGGGWPGLRMVRGPAPVAPEAPVRVFGLASQAWG